MNTFCCVAVEASGKTNAKVHDLRVPVVGPFPCATIRIGKRAAAVFEDGSVYLEGCSSDAAVRIAWGAFMQSASQRCDYQVHVWDRVVRCRVFTVSLARPVDIAAVAHATGAPLSDFFPEHMIDIERGATEILIKRDGRMHIRDLDPVAARAAAQWIVELLEGI